MRSIVFFIWIPFSVWSQATVDVKLFLDKAVEELNIDNPINPEDVDFPWIEEFEFRTRTNDFEFDKQEYILRLSPSTSKKRRAQQELYEGYVNRPEFEQLKEYCSSVYDIHADWLTLYLSHEVKAVLDRMDSIHADREAVFERMMDGGDFELSELVKIQKDKSQLATSRYELQAEVDMIKRDRGFIQDQMSFDGFIDILSVKNALLVGALEGQDIEDSEIRHEMDLIDRELALEEAERRQYIDFLELRYEGPHSQTLNERISLGISLRLPNSGNRRLKMQELRLERERLQSETLRNQASREERLEAVHNKLLQDIGLFERYTATVEREQVELDRLGQALMRREGFSPLLLLDIEERLVEIRLELLDLQEDIYEDYLEYLYRSGALCSDSRRAFLSR